MSRHEYLGGCCFPFYHGKEGDATCGANTTESQNTANYVERRSDAALTVQSGEAAAGLDEMVEQAELEIFGETPKESWSTPPEIKCIIRRACEEWGEKRAIKQWEMDTDAYAKETAKHLDTIAELQRRLRTWEKVEQGHKDHIAELESKLAACADKK